MTAFPDDTHVFESKKLTTSLPGTSIAKSASAGTLIGRVGNSAPFVIGSQSELTMPANGQLMLGVNDDHFADDNGFFSVGVARQAAVRRR